MTDGQLTADVERYAQAAAGNAMPSTVPSDPLIGGATPIEQVLRMLGLAANSGDPEDNATGADEHARRAAMTSAAAEAFADQDAVAADDMTAVVPQDQSTAAARELPQLLAGISAAVSGGLSGILQPLGQIPQQIAQGAQQVLQAGAGLSPAVSAISDDEFGGSDDASLSGELSDEELDFDVDDFGGVGLPDGTAVLGDTTGIGSSPGPAIMLAPPATPSAATLPASAPGTPIPASTAHIPAAGAGAGMAGMPMIPPGGVNGAGGTERDAKTDTKRLTTPPVRNGAPVQGRITAAPPVITTTVEGRPVPARRIVMPSGMQTE